MTTRDRRVRLRFTVSVVVLVAITLVTMDARDVGVLESVKASLGNVLTGADGGLGAFTSPFRNAWHGMGEYDQLKEENARLQEELARKENESRDEALASKQLAELAELSKVTLLADFDRVTARRTAGTNSNWDSNTLYIDAGRRDGVTEGMPVVNADGLIGTVEQAYEGRSQVRLITEVDLRFSVRIVEINLLGVGHGAGDADRPWIVDSAVDLDAPVTLGQQVVTSGVADSKFPADIPVGAISRIQPDDAQNLTRLDVDLAVDFDSIEFVHVIAWTPDGPRPQPGAGADASTSNGDDAGGADTGGDGPTTTGRGPADPFDPGDSQVGVDPGASTTIATASSSTTVAGAGTGGG
ncbi:MAG: rod shape-determining protein MreC [Microthrixaceae bacterium]